MLSGEVSVDEMTTRGGVIKHLGRGGHRGRCTAFTKKVITKSRIWLKTIPYPKICFTMFAQPALLLLSVVAIRFLSLFFLKSFKKSPKTVQFFVPFRSYTKYFIFNIQLKERTWNTHATKREELLSV